MVFFPRTGSISCFLEHEAAKVNSSFISRIQMVLYMWKKTNHIKTNTSERVKECKSFSHSHLSFQYVRFTVTKRVIYDTVRKINITLLQAIKRKETKCQDTMFQLLGRQCLE